MPQAAPSHLSLPARVWELDGLRGLLALWVVVSHLFCWSGYATFAAPWPLNRMWNNLIFAGPAVETFMILSGFAITFLLHARRTSYAGFLSGRFFRLFPVYLVCLGVAAATSFLIPTILGTASWRDTVYFTSIHDTYVSERAHPGQHLFWHLSLLHGAVPQITLAQSATAFLPPAWSISLEWQYYLVAPLIAFAVRSGVGLLLVCGVAWCGIYNGSPWVTPALAFPVHLPLFLVGIGSYHLYAASTRAGTVGAAGRTTIIAGLLGAAILSRWHTIAFALWAVCFGCIFVERSDPIGRTLAAVRHVLLDRRLQYLGRISYPLYLVHWPVIIGLVYLMLRMQPTLSSVQAVTELLIVGLPVILSVAALVNRFVEDPGIEFGRRLGTSGAIGCKPATIKQTKT